VAITPTGRYKYTLFFKFFYFTTHKPSVTVERRPRGSLERVGVTLWYGLVIKVGGIVGGVVSLIEQVGQ